MGDSVELLRDRRQLVIKAPTVVLTYLKDALSVLDPNARFIKAKFPLSDWDGKRHFLRGSKCGLGLKHRVISLLKRQCDAKDIVDHAPTGIDVAFGQHLNGITLVPDQVEASKALLGTDTGCVELDVSSGKSYILMNLAACALEHNPSWKVVILVPRKALLYQFFKDAQKVLPKYGIGILGDGHRQLNQITVATVATAVAASHIKNSKVIQDWMKEVDVVITDEAHRSVAETWEAIYDQAGAKIMWGVSAKLTFSAKNRILERALEATFGKPLYQGSVAEFRVPVEVITYQFKDWDGKYADASPKLVDGVSVAYLSDGKWKRGTYVGIDADGNPNKLCFGGDGKLDKTAYGVYASGKKVEDLNSENVIYATAHDMGIMEFADRDTWALKLGAKFATAGEIFLVSVSRDRHGKKLVKRFTAAGMVVEHLSGKTTTGEMHRIMEAWKNKTIDGVIAHHAVVSEGLSIPSLWHFIKLDGQAGEMVLHQQIGRPARCEEGKTVGRMHIPVDVQHPKLLANSRAMIRYYHKISKTITAERHANVSGFLPEFNSP